MFPSRLFTNEFKSMYRLLALNKYSRCLHKRLQRLINDNAKVGATKDRIYKLEGVKFIFTQVILFSFTMYFLYSFCLN